MFWKVIVAVVAFVIDSQWNRCEEKTPNRLWFGWINFLSKDDPYLFDPIFSQWHSIFGNTVWSVLPVLESSPSWLKKLHPKPPGGVTTNLPPLTCRIPSKSMQISLQWPRKVPKGSFPTPAFPGQGWKMIRSQSHNPNMILGSQNPHDHKYWVLPISISDHINPYHIIISYPGEFCIKQSH